MRQGNTISTRSQVKINNAVVNMGLAYGTNGVAAPAGTLLSDPSKGAVWLEIRYVDDVTIGNTTYHANDIAVTLDTSTPIQNVYLSLDADQSTPVASVAEGVAGSEQGIKYRETVYYSKSTNGTLNTRIIADKEFEVFLHS